MLSKEQLSGMEQINDAVNNLDTQSQDVIVTDEIAKLIIPNADVKKSKSKKKIKAKYMDLKHDSSYDTKTNQVANKKINLLKPETASKKEKEEEDEWESF